MEAAPVVTLILTGAAILVVAAFLITVIYQLARVFERLNIILGVVGQVIEKTEVLDPILSDIAANVEAGNVAVAGAVDRLKVRKGAVDAPEPQSAPLEPPPTVYTNY